MARLTRLVLPHTALFEFPPSFLWLTQLKHLDLTHCSFQSLPVTCASKSSPKLMMFSRIDSQVYFGELAQLEYLSLKDNLMKDLPPTFHLLKSLK